MVSDEREKNGTNLLQLCHIAAVLESISNHEFHCIMCCQAEEEELEKLEKSAVQHEELLAMARDDAEDAESQASIAK
jgi:hypothetical protein